MSKSKTFTLRPNPKTQTLCEKVINILSFNVSWCNLWQLFPYDIWWWLSPKFEEPLSSRLVYFPWVASKSSTWFHKFGVSIFKFECSDADLIFTQRLFTRDCLFINKRALLQNLVMMFIDVQHYAYGYSSCSKSNAAWRKIIYCRIICKIYIIKLHSMQFVVGQNKCIKTGPRLK